MSADLKDDATPSAEALPTLVYDVVRHRGHWRILHAGKRSSPHANQRAATEAAMALAKERQATGRMVSVRLNRTDGKVLEVDLMGASDVENLV